MNNDRDRYYQLKAAELSKRRYKQSDDETVKMFLTLAAIGLGLVFSLGLLSPGVWLVTYLNVLYPEGFSGGVSWLIAIGFTGTIVGLFYGISKSKIKTLVFYSVLVVCFSTASIYVPSPLGHESVAKSAIYLFTGFDDPLKAK